MNIEAIKKSLEESTNKKQKFLKYLHEIGFFNTKTSLKKCLKLIKDIDGFEINYDYARLIVLKEKESFGKVVSQSQKKINVIEKQNNISNPSIEEINKAVQNLKVEVSAQESNLETGFRIEDLISMKIDDLPEELKDISTVTIQDQIFDVRSASYPDFKFFGSDDEEFNFVKTMESKGFLKGSEEYKFELSQVKLRGKRRKEYREANKQFERIAKKFTN